MNEHKTAMARTKPSAPATWLNEHCLIQGRALDYGCGRGKDADTFAMERYDPFYSPKCPRGKFDTILCTFVLNVIDNQRSRDLVVTDIISKLTPDGCAYITVRTDKKDLKGHTKTGTWQGLITLDLPVVHRGSGYVIYKATRRKQHGQNAEAVQKPTTRQVASRAAA